MVNFPTQITDSDSQSRVLLAFFLSNSASICFLMTYRLLGNSDHVVVSVSIYLPSNSKQDALFHCIAYDYFFAD